MIASFVQLFLSGMADGRYEAHSVVILVYYYLLRKYGSQQAAKQ